MWGKALYVEVLPGKEATRMVLKFPPFFPHRRNADGSFDSICLKCLLTIANERTETDLTKHEKHHVCIPSILSQRTFDRAFEKAGYST